MPTKNLSKGRVFAILPAAGSGTRMGDPLPKQYLEINGLPMIVHTLTAIARVQRIQTIVVVIASDDVHWDPMIARHGHGRGDGHEHGQNQNQNQNQQLRDRLQVFRVGGNTRAESVLNGLRAVASEFGENDRAMVHDAARPCIRSELIEQFLDELEDDPIGGLLALPVADTLKRGSADQRVEQTVNRQQLWRAQTPQMFRAGLLGKALAGMPEATDESQAVEALGYQPKLVIGESANLKVTYATDMKIAQLLLAEGRVVTR
ncbi:MAG: 2-C-methyl-D-erythritol 4-phosphate cytidylyltransferase [Aeromicrobium sp.]|nr:2-C-methyl-D-erythritol 4-phosphate cytidylyltransferase [Burkholderiales bacterium]